MNWGERYQLNDECITAGCDDGVHTDLGFTRIAVNFKFHSLF